ncbi:hypothetical protein BDV19DRAFT_362715 [Aspergillus venezuelensis]
MIASSRKQVGCGLVSAGPGATFPVPSPVRRQSCSQSTPSTLMTRTPGLRTRVPGTERGDRHPSPTEAGCQSLNRKPQNTRRKGAKGSDPHPGYWMESWNMFLALDPHRDLRVATATLRVMEMETMVVSCHGDH